MDRIEISGLTVFAHHGVHQRERQEGQPFVVDVTLDRDLTVPAHSDDLTDTVDYGALAERLADEVRRTRFRLLEALAEHLADLALAEPGVQAVTVRVAKPQVALEAQVDAVAVVLHRTGEPAA